MRKFFESIGNCFFKKGTKEKIFETDKMIYGQTQKELTKEVEEYYRVMKANVDKYLDKFYSFKGQREQIGDWFRGKFSNGDDKDKFKEKLLHDMLEATICPDYDLTQRIMNICTKANNDFNDKLLQILKNNKVGMKKGNYMFHIQSAIDIYKNLCIPENAFNPLKVAGTGIATGVVSSAIADGVFAGFLDNILPGAIAESIAGPIGIGFGIMVGIAINYAGLKIDELINREKYKNSLINYIDSEKDLYIEIILRYFHAHTEYSKSVYSGQTILSLPNAV